jgi:hypothetical protein
MLLSVIIPIGGIITIVLKYRRIINHLARLKDINPR